jgi:PAS domain-containing protein
MDDKMVLSGEMNELKKTIEYLQQLKEKLQRSEEQYRFLAEHSIDVIWRIDEQFQFVYVSPAVKNILGYQAEELVGRHLFCILTQEAINAVVQGHANRKPFIYPGWTAICLYET